MSLQRHRKRERWRVIELFEERYLIIIDDIWHHGEWDIMKKSFPENNLRSRVVITTRIHSLPGSRDDFGNKNLYIRMNPRWADIRRLPYRPGSWVTRLPYGLGSWVETGRWIYTYGREDVAALMKPAMVGEGFDCNHPIVRMCGGVPLALVCMFSAMAMVQEQQEQLMVHINVRDVQDMIMMTVKRSGIHNTPGFEPLLESLQLGYDDLPHPMLKTCLLYCSIYPQDYPFDMDDLAMRWVAEGFIHKEDEAQDYFEELVNRQFILSEDSSGPYQINPVMRNFLRWKSHEDNFITWSPNITSANARGIHRLCIDGYPVGDDAAEEVDPWYGLDWSQVRSLVVFKGGQRGVPFEKLEHMRMLDIQVENGLQNDDVKDICGLLRVRHLFGLQGNGISAIPPEIARLQYLETLQVRETSIKELPGEIGDLQQLKTLDISDNEYLVELPREMGKLKNLETLCMSGTNMAELPLEIVRLKKLKTLDVSDNERITELPREIGKLEHLRTLKAANTEITSLPSEIGNLQNLETLDLGRNYRLTVLPREIGKLQNLKRLLMSNTPVVRLPREIWGLKKLEKLDLGDIISALPWEAGQLSELKGLPECVRKVMKNSDVLSCKLAGEILSIRMTSEVDDNGGLIVGTKHMHIPLWIKEHLNDLGSLDIRICKLEKRDVKILREMPNLMELRLRFEVIPRKPIAINGEGFPMLYELVVDCRVPPVITFEKGAMPVLHRLCFEYRFYGGPPANKVPQLGIKHLRRLCWVEFICNEEWYGGAAERMSMSAIIDVVRKEAQEHPNKIYFEVSGREDEEFPAAKKE